jgi:hypothetical protein
MASSIAEDKSGRGWSFLGTSAGDIGGVDAMEAMELSAVARIVGTDPEELSLALWSAAGEGRGGLSRPRLRPAVVSPRPGWRRRVRVARFDEIGVTIDRGGRVAESSDVALLLRLRDLESTGESRCGR